MVSELAEEEDARVVEQEINRVEASIANEQLGKLFEGDDERDDEAAQEKIEFPELDRPAGKSRVEDQGEQTHQDEMPDLVTVGHVSDGTKEELRIFPVGQEDDHDQDENVYARQPFHLHRRKDVSQLLLLII